MYWPPRSAGGLPANGNNVNRGHVVSAPIFRRFLLPLREHVVNASGAEAALPAGVVTQGAEEIHFPESRPKCFAEVELAIRALPHEESGQALLPRRPDHEVRVGLAA